MPGDQTNVDDMPYVIGLAMDIPLLTLIRNIKVS